MIRALAAVVVTFVAVTAVLTARLFLYPSSRTPTRADAVVTFVGGRGERLDTALRLVHAGVARNLVIPNGTAPTWPQANRLCRNRTSFKVFCPDPSPDTTRGEARAISSVARQHGWHSVVLVTSTYHVTRARLLLSRCYDGHVDTVKAGPGLSPGRYLLRVSHEWAGLAEAVIVTRGC